MDLRADIPMTNQSKIWNPITCRPVRRPYFLMTSFRRFSVLQLERQIGAQLHVP